MKTKKIINQNKIKQGHIIENGLSFISIGRHGLLSSTYRDCLQLE